LICCSVRFVELASATFGIDDSLSTEQLPCRRFLERKSKIKLEIGFVFNYKLKKHLFSYSEPGKTTEQEHTPEREGLVEVKSGKSIRLEHISDARSFDYTFEEHLEAFKLF
jgi:hypothetical protein